jgi:hypothetical protein
LAILHGSLLVNGRGKRFQRRLANPLRSITPQGSRSPSLVTDRPNNEFLGRAVGDKDPKEMLTFCEARRFKSCGIGQLNRYL